MAVKWFVDKSLVWCTFNLLGRVNLILDSVQFMHECKSVVEMVNNYYVSCGVPSICYGAFA